MSEVLLEYPGGELTLRFDYDDNGAIFRSGLRFGKVRALRHRAELYSTAEQIEAACDTLVEVDRSPWVAELREAAPADLRDSWEMRHFMIYFDSSGCYEVVAATWEALPSEQGARVRDQGDSRVELPAWVVDAAGFHRLLVQGLLDLTPWHLMTESEMGERGVGLQRRYPERELWPFARRQDRDDVACWERSQPGAVIVIHDFASAGHEQRQRYSSFWDWFRAAIEDMIEFEP